MVRSSHEKRFSAPRRGNFGGFSLFRGQVQNPGFCDLQNCFSELFFTTVFHNGVFDDVVSLCETQHSVSSGEEGAERNGNTPIRG